MKKWKQLLQQLIDAIRVSSIHLEIANETRRQFNEIGEQQLQASKDATELQKQAKAELLDTYQKTLDCQLEQGSALRDFEARLSKLEAACFDHFALQRHTRRAKVDDVPKPSDILEQVLVES